MVLEHLRRYYKNVYIIALLCFLMYFILRKRVLWNFKETVKNKETRSNKQTKKIRKIKPLQTFEQKYNPLFQLSIYF